MKAGLSSAIIVEKPNVKVRLSLQCLRRAGAAPHSHCLTTYLRCFLG